MIVHHSSTGGQLACENPRAIGMEAKQVTFKIFRKPFQKFQNFWTISHWFAALKIHFILSQNQLKGSVQREIFFNR